MEFVSRKLHCLGDYFARRLTRGQEQEINALDAYLEFIFKVLWWEDTKFSLKVFLAFNHLFWLILFLSLRLYGTISCVIMILFLLDTLYREKVLNEYQGEYSGTFEEFKVAVYEIFVILQALRRDSPFTFAALMSVTFLITRIISQNVSGYSLLYLLFLSLFFVPLVYKYLPENHVERIRNSFTTLSTSRHVLAEEELIPFIFNKDLNRKDPELDSLLTDRTADSVTNSLASGISAMPSYQDVLDVRDELKEDDLLPTQFPRGLSCTPGELSSDSDSEHKEIRFDSDHFNTSSSEEEAYIKGLNISDVPKPNQPEGEGIRGMLSSVANMGSNLVTNLLVTSVIATRQERRRSSSDSEFEIINNDDVDQ